MSFRYSALGVKRAVNISKELIDEFNSKNNTNIQVDITSIDNYKTIIKVWNQLSKSDSIGMKVVVFKNDDEKAYLKFADSECEKLASIDCLISYIATVVYEKLRGVHYFNQITLKQRKSDITLVEVTWEDNRTSVLEIHALAIGHKRGLLNCRNIKISKAGRISTTNRINGTIWC